MGPKAATQPAKVAVKLPQTIKSDAIPKVSVSIPKPSPTVTEKAIDCVSTVVKKEEHKSPKSTEKIVDKVNVVQMKPAENAEKHDKSFEKPIETKTSQPKAANVEIDRTQPAKMDIDLVSLILF